MTEKRFTYEYDEEYKGNLFDNKMDTFYPIEDSDENIKLLCDNLNGLVEENDELKQFKEKLFNVLDKKITQNEEAIEFGIKQGVDVGAMSFHTDMLKMFRKELQE